MKKILKNITSTVIAAFLVVTVFGLSVPTHPAEAGGLDGRATEMTALKNAASSASSAISNATTAAGTMSLVTKETVLDGIGWAIAKQMVSSMTRSLINWINSGFEGSPSFITDLNGFLLDALDTAAGEYIKSLGGIGEFICSPFKLDVQAALSISYAQARSGMPSGATAPSCKLTDIANNIEGFFAGITDGGWGDWLQVTSNPQNTPYGAYLEAQARLKIKLQNEAGQEIEIANWGDGFLSKKICQKIENTSSENCTISTPGQVISEALTFQLSTGPRSLIEADEINELIGALINQLTLKAMEGINGLLGLSGGTGYTDYSSTTRPYIDEAVDEQFLLNSAMFRSQMDSALATENSYIGLATSTLASSRARLKLVSDGQDAMNAFFAGTSSLASLININSSNTLATAKANLATAYRGNPSDSQKQRLDTIQTQLNTISNSLTIIATMSDRFEAGADLNTISFSQLETESARIKNDLTELVTELTPIVPVILTNIVKLQDLINKYDTASSAATTTGSSTRSVSAIRQDVIIDFVALVNGGTLTSPVTVTIKRVEWERKLRN